MAGIHVQVCRMTKFTTPAVVSSSVENVLAQLIPTLGWRTGLIQLRLFAKTFAGANASVTLTVYNSMVSGDNPASVMNETASPLASVVIDGNFAADTMKSVAFSSSVPIGPYVTVMMKWTGGAAAPTGDITIAVDLIGRDT